MTLDREFDRIASAWLEDGPTELSERVLDAVVDEIHLTRQRHVTRVPWRFPTMSMPARVAALVAVGAFLIAGALAIGGVGGHSGPVPTVAPTAVPPPSAAAALTLDATFTSPWHGYTVKYPSGWRATPATRAWPPGTLVDPGNPAADELQGTNARLTATQQLYSVGQIAENWLQAYCDLRRQSGCTSTAGWQRIEIAGSPAYVDVDGATGRPGALTPTGRTFEAVVALVNRAYVFTMDGDVDRATFDAFLGSIALKPADAVDMPPLTGTFTSPTYGYTIGRSPSWAATAATRKWTGTSPDSSFMDGLDVGSDTNIGAMSQPLGNRTFDEFLATFYAGQHASYVGTGCDDGGAPSTWPTIQIGDQIGRIEIVCSVASDEALVAVGGRVYLFELGHSDRGFPLAAFRQVLATVTFDPARAKS